MRVLLQTNMLLWGILLSSIPIMAQQPEKYYKPPVAPILKFSHLSLIDPLNSIQFALEHQTFKNQSLQHEVGYITNLSSNDDQNKNQKGIRIRNEYRFYLEPDESKLGGLYVAPEILFIYLSYTKTGTFGMLCGDSDPWNCPYYQIMDYQVKKQVFAFHPKVGYQAIFGRFAFDFYGGLGYRYVSVWNEDKPPNQNDWDEDFWGFRKDEGTYRLPSMSFGFKIGYVLKKRPKEDLEEKEDLPYYQENY